jgi:hypothetical protein
MTHIQILLRTPHDNEILEDVPINRINDKLLYETNERGWIELSFGEWVTQYLQDMPGHQLILKGVDY